MAQVFAINHDTSTNLTDATNYSSSSGADVSIGPAGAMCGTTNGLIVLVDDNTLDRGRKLCNKSVLFRYRFYIDPNSITMADLDRFTVQLLLQDGGGYLQVCKIDLRYTTASGYNLRFTCYNDITGTAGSEDYLITDAPHYVEVYCVQATNSTSNDGAYYWWVDGNSGGADITGIDNYNLMFDQNFRFDIGAPIADRDAGTTGTIYLDEIVANNDGGAIGPVNTSVALAIADGSHAHTADAPALTQHNILAVQDGANGHTADAIALVQHSILDVQDGVHAHTAESPAQTQHNILVIQDGGHAHTADAPALTQHNIISIVDASHGHTAENITLTAYIPTFQIVIQDAIHLHEANNIDLVQHISLAIADATHGHGAENIAIAFHMPGRVIMTDSSQYLVMVADASLGMVVVEDARTPETVLIGDTDNG